MKYLILLLPLLLTPLAMSEQGDSEHKSEEKEEVEVSEQQGLAAFEDIYRVSQHPRCMNCHPSGDAPLQTDNSIPHSMAITRFSPTVGLMCSTCHRDVGLPDIKNLPPADPHWRMPPAEMAFEGRSEAELCKQLTDTSQTGGRDPEALADHVEHDHLLTSSWSSEREAPPLSHEELVKRFRTWAAAGGPCPEGE